MIAKLILTSAILAVAITSAEAQTVKFAGCPFRGIEPGCLLIRSGGEVYDIGSARPRPRTGFLGIAGHGTAAGPFGFCWAKPLKNVKWWYTKQKCPK